MGIVSTRSRHEAGVIAVTSVLMVNVAAVLVTVIPVKRARYVRLKKQKDDYLPGPYGSEWECEEPIKKWNIFN